MSADIIGGFPETDPNCKGCGKPLTIENAWMTDGCPCNTALGVNSMNETRWRLLMNLQQQQSRDLASVTNVLDICGAPRTCPDSDGGTSNLTFLGRMRELQAMLETAKGTA